MAVTVGKLIERLRAPLQLEQLGGAHGHDREIENPDVSSPGLALAGYVGRFTAQRVQILGETEVTYLSTLGEAERGRILTQFFSFPIPCVFITKGLEAVPPLLDLAAAARVPVLRSPLKTAEVYRRLKPVMEELFWRSFLIRYVMSSDFRSIRLGAFSVGSFVVTVVLFGLEHQLWLAGMMAGAAYNVVLYRTGRIWPCILAHAVTNLILGGHVLMTGEWIWW